MRALCSRALDGHWHVDFQQKQAYAHAGRRNTSAALSAVVYVLMSVQILDVLVQEQVHVHGCILGE